MIPTRGQGTETSVRPERTGRGTLGLTRLRMGTRSPQRLSREFGRGTYRGQRLKPGQSLELGERDPPHPRPTSSLPKLGRATVTHT